MRSAKRIEMAASVEEQQLLDRVNAMCRGDVDITMDAALREILDFGVKPLSRALGALLGGSLTQKAVLSRMVFMSLYTLGNRAKNMSGGGQDDIKTRRVMYKFHEEQTKAWLSGTLLPRLGTTGEPLLVAFSECWRAHRLFVEWMRKMFVYLDSDARREGALMPHDSLTAVGLELFKTVVFDKKKGAVNQTIQTLINRVRAGEVADISVVKAAVGMFISCGMIGYNRQLADDKALEVMLHNAPAEGNTVYERDIEKPFLESTRAYFIEQGRLWLASLSSTEYLQRAEVAIEAELRRVDTFMNAITRPKVAKVCHDTLFVAHMRDVLTQPSGLESTLWALGDDAGEGAGEGAGAGSRVDKRPDIHRFFTAFSTAPGGIALMSDIFRAHVARAGSELGRLRHSSVEPAPGADGAPAAGPKGPSPLLQPDYTDDILRLFKRLRSLVAVQFEGHLEMERALRRGFEDVLNTTEFPHNHAEILATYVDGVLRGRKGATSLTDAQIEDAVEHLVQVFMFLADKDVFKDYYKNFLARRLLTQKSFSIEIEKHAISQFKQACGPQFTFVLESCLTDFAASKDVTEAFKRSATRTDVEELAVYALKRASWPPFNEFAGTHLPSSMAAAVKAFSGYYAAQNPTRKLVFCLSQGSATVTIQFDAGRHSINCTTLQAVVLLVLGNDTNSLSFEQLATCTGIDKGDLKRIVGSLALASKATRIVAKVPPAPTIKDSDILSIAWDFKSPKRDLSVPAPMLVSKAVEGVAAAEPERAEALDAAIVRIMKSRKVMQHHDLVHEVTTQIKFFRADARAIKRRIAALMDKYIRREDPSSSTSPYVYEPGNGE